MVVTVNWDKEKVEAEICFVYGTFITKTTFISQYYLHRVIIICHYMSVVLHIVEMVAWQNVAFLTQNSRGHVQTL